MTKVTSLRENWIALLLMIGAAVVWLPVVLTSGFTLDDRLVALSVGDDGLVHPRIAELQPLSTYFSTHYWGDTRVSDGLFRPFTILSFALRYAWFGDSSVVAHAINVALHAAAVVLSYALLRRLALGVLASVVGAAMFAVCAVHVEVVAGVVGRSELLAFTFGAGGAWLALPVGARAQTGRALILRGLGAAICFFVAYGSKESAIAWAPFVFILAWALGRIDGRQSLPIAVPWLAAIVFVPLVAFLLLRQQMLSGLAEPIPSIAWTANPLAHTDTVTRISNAALVLLHGLRLLVLPFGLSSDWGPMLLGQTGSLAGIAIASAALLVAIGVFALLRARRAPRVFVAVAAFFGFSFMTSNIPFAIGTIFGERLLFAPSLALAITVAVIVERLPSLEAAARSGIAVALAALFALQLGLMQARVPAWKNDATLVATDVARHPNSIRLQIAAAVAAEARGDAQEAAERYQYVIAIEPQFRLAYVNLASLALRTNKHDLVEPLLEQASMAKHGDRIDHAKIAGNRGLLRLTQKRDREAADAFAESLEKAPHLVQTWDQLMALRRRGIVDDDWLRAVVKSNRHRPRDLPYWAAYSWLLRAKPGDESSIRALTASERMLQSFPEALALRRYLQQRIQELRR